MRRVSATPGTDPALLARSVTDTYGKQIVVYLNTCDGTFSSPIVTTLNIPDTTGALVVGDFNEDGHPDLIVGTIAAPEQDDLLLLLLGKATGPSLLARFYPARLASRTPPWWISITTHILT